MIILINHKHIQAWLGVCKLLYVYPAAVAVCAAPSGYVRLPSCLEGSTTKCADTSGTGVEFDIVSAVDADGRCQLLQPLLLSLPIVCGDGVSVCIQMGAGESEGAWGGLGSANCYVYPTAIVLCAVPADWVRLPVCLEGCTSECAGTCGRGCST